MSGFEVVGVVLGVLPLVVSGLENYQQGLSILSSAWHYENTVSNLIITFETAALRFRDTCEILLGPLFLSPDEYAVLLEDPAGAEWAKPDVQEKLKTRLGNASPTYLRLVGRLHKALLKFATKMALDPNNDMKASERQQVEGKGPDLTLEYSLRGASNRYWRSIKLGFDNGNLEKLLEGIEKDLFRLERLVESSDRVAPIREEGRRDKKNKLQWQSVRESARSLFNAISQGWSCNCQGCHESYLRLNICAQQQTEDPGCQFALLIPFGSPHTSGWWKIDIVSYTVDDLSLDAPAATSQPSSGSIKKQGITFLITAIDDLSVTKSGMIPKSVKSAAKISNLCKVLKQTVQPKSEVGYLADQTWHHHISSTIPEKDISMHSDLVSVGDILGRRQTLLSHQQYLGLSTREKYRTALLLASAVLQLFQTPWLTDVRALDDVYITQNKGKQPFTKRELYILGQAQATSTSRQSSLQQKRFWIANELLFALGIYLLEISYGQSLATFKSPADVDQNGNDTLLTEHSIAARLADDIVNREPSKYADAVRRCLYCRFDTSSTDLEDVTLQEQFHAAVITPLKELDSVFS